MREFVDDKRDGQMESASQLRIKLREAEKRERRAKEVCMGCDGKGYICDTTYDRTGVDTPCGRCHGSGLPAERVEKIISDAFAPYQRKHST